MSNPKKSHAFIITFILILLLLLLGYWLFNNREKIFKTGEFSIGRIFESLIESTDRKPLDTVWDNIFNPNKNPDETDPNGYVYDPNNNIHNFPVVGLSANPSSVGEGGSSTVNWTSSGATSCETGDGKQVGTSGSFTTGPLSSSKSYNVKCRGTNGTISNNFIIQVGDKKINPNKFPIVSGGANPSVIKPGESSTIKWESINTTVCNSGPGNPTTRSGSFSTGPIYTTTSYSIVCTGDNGTSGKNIFVIVNDSSGSNTFPGSNAVCSDGKDNDTDGLTDSKDPNCHIDGDLNKEYISSHYSENTNPGSNTFPGSNAVCSDGKDNDTDGLTDSKDPNCHIDGDLNKEYISSHYSENTNPGSNTFPGSNAVCSDGKDNDTDGLTDSKDPNCHIDGDLNKEYISSHYSENTNPGGLPTPGEEGSKPGNTFCTQNKITKILYMGNTNNDKAQVVSLQTILSKLTSSLGTKYLNVSDIDGDFGLTTKNAVARFQADNKLTQKNGTVDGVTMNKINELCPPPPGGEGKVGICPKPEAVNYPDCNKNIKGECLNGSTNTATCSLEKKEVNKCAVFDQYPLEFTDKEKADLAELLRKFYLLAPTLKTEDDLNLVYNEIDRYKSLIEQTKELTKKCYLESAANQEWLYNGKEAWSFCSRNPNLCEPTDTFNRSYTGPTIRFGNPWFKSDNIGTYIDEKNAREMYPLGIKINTDPNYTLKVKDGDKDLVTPLITKKPMAQFKRNNHTLWDDQEEHVSFDLNAVMIDRIREFELLLNIW